MNLRSLLDSEAKMLNRQLKLEFMRMAGFTAKELDGINQKIKVAHVQAWGQPSDEDMRGQDRRRKVEKVFGY